MTQHPETPAYLVLEDGTVYEGVSIGATGTTFGELVFNTAFTGYQEILTDPSYKGQVVMMTTPEMGNYGIVDTDVESNTCHAAGFVVRRLSPVTSNWRAQASLKDYLTQHGVVGIEGVDTRAITRKVRQVGSPKMAITTDRIADLTGLIADIKAQPDFAEQNFVAVVSTPSPYVVKGADTDKSQYRLGRLAVVDYGIKRSILNQLKPFVDEMMVLPCSTTLDEIKAYSPDAVFLSNGPGDPNALPHAIELAQQLMANDIAVFGICLGHQILSIACGAKVVKMPFGHHGGNHPVRDLTKGVNIITAQNHSYCVEDASIPENTLEVTHINLNDNTIEGIRHKSKMALSVQFHPEAGPGPHDAHYLFEWFFEQLVQKSPALV